MTALSEIIRSEGKRVGAAQKASVVRAGAKYRSEQGSDYEPGVSAETVGSKVLFLGMVTLPQEREPGRTCTNGMRLPSTAQRRNRDMDRRPATASRGGTARRLHLHSCKRAACCCQPRRETRGLYRHTQRTNGPGKRRAVS